MQMKKRMRFILIAALFVILLPFYSSAAETQPAEQSIEAVPDEAPTDGPDGQMQEEGGIVDPLEPWNHLMFTFNDRLYFWVMKPATTVYNTIVPEWGRPLVIGRDTRAADRRTAFLLLEGCGSLKGGL